MSPLRRFTLCIALLCSLSASAAAQAPVLRKVEPPNWWIGLADPMLLIVGENLHGARVSVKSPGVSIASSEVNAEGRYIFVDLKIAANARPGQISLVVETPRGSSQIPFSLARRRAATEGFAGLDATDVIYLIMPDRFADGDPANNEPPEGPGTYDRKRERAYHGGDLKGIRDKLPYLKDLGVTALWLNPIYENDDRSANDYHGYGAVDFYDIEEHFGTLQDYKDLVTAAHQHGIKVLLDVVPNHSGPRHPWTVHPPEPDWLHGTTQQHIAARSPFQPLTDPHASPRQFEDVVKGWFANVLPDIDQRNPRTAKYLAQNAIWWAETGGLDGFRLDTAPYLYREFWRYFHQEIAKVYPKFTTIGEVFHEEPTVTSYFAGGHAPAGVDTGITTVFDFPMYFAIRDVVIRDAPAKRFAEVLRHDWLYPRPEKLVTFIGNHDVTRFAGEQGSSPPKLKLAFSLLATLRGVPQLYTGDEIAMPGGNDPDNRRDFPGGFPGDPRNAFSADGRTAEENDVFNHLKAMLALRRQHPALQDGKHWHIAVEKSYYAFARVNARQKLLVVFHNGDAPANLEFDLALTSLEGAKQLVPLMNAPAATISGNKAAVPAPARSLVIYEVK